MYRKFKPEILGQEEAKDNNEKIANIRKAYKDELTKNGKQGMTEFDRAIKKTLSHSNNKKFHKLDRSN